MASASLSGISMLNSCEQLASCRYSSQSHGEYAYLLNGHHDLNNIKAVQAQVVCEVGSSVNLSIPCQTIQYHRACSAKFRAKEERTLLASETYSHEHISYVDAAESTAVHTLSKFFNKLTIRPSTSSLERLAGAE